MHARSLSSQVSSSKTRMGLLSGLFASPHSAVEAPVVGMNVQQLKAVVLHDFDRSRLKFSSRVALKKWEIFCIPAIPIAHRLPAWLARVRLLTELEDGRKLSSGFHVYRYQQEFFTWQLISDGTAGPAFEAPFSLSRLFLFLCRRFHMPLCTRPATFLHSPSCFRLNKNCDAAYMLFRGL